jgi:inorganic pyrophosphatase
MVLANFPLEAKKFEVQAYKRPSNVKKLRETHIPFSGAPQKHPYDKEKIVLIADPISSNTFYYEFMADDISYVEELPNIGTSADEIITMVRIWVRKKSIAIRSLPFIVEDVMPLTSLE